MRLIILLICSFCIISPAHAQFWQEQELQQREQNDRNAKRSMEQLIELQEKFRSVKLKEELKPEISKE